MGRKLATFILNGETIDYYADSATVLYHGTSREVAEIVLRDGLQPRTGAFFRSVYPRARVRPVVSAADEMHKRKVFSACRFAVARLLNKEKHQVTREDFLAHAAALVIERDRDRFQQATAMDKPQRGIERFDYYSFDPIRVDHLLADAELAEFLKVFLDHLDRESAAR